MINPLNKNITLPLSSFLDILWHNGCKEFVEVDNEMAFLIDALDRDKSFCHVQMPDPQYNNLTKPRLWQIRLWLMDYEKNLLDKQKSLERSIKWNRRLEIIEELACAYVSMLCLDKDDAITKATYIVEKRQIKMAKILGVDITEIVL